MEEICDICGKEFKNKAGLEGHKRLTHKKAVSSGSISAPQGETAIELIKQLLQRKGILKNEEELLMECLAEDRILSQKEKEEQRSKWYNQWERNVLNPAIKKAKDEAYSLGIQTGRNEGRVIGWDENKVFCFDCGKFIDLNTLRSTAHCPDCNFKLQVMQRKTLDSSLNEMQRQRLSNEAITKQKIETEIEKKKEIWNFKGVIEDQQNENEELKKEKENAITLLQEQEKKIQRQDDIIKEYPIKAKSLTSVKTIPAVDDNTTTGKGVSAVTLNEDAGSLDLSGIKNQ